MARARDVGLLSDMAFDSKSNCLCERITNGKNGTELGYVEIDHQSYSWVYKINRLYLRYQLTCLRAPNVYLAVVIQSRRTPIQRYYQRVDES